MKLGHHLLQIGDPQLPIRAIRAAEHKDSQHRVHLPQQEASQKKTWHRIDLLNLRHMHTHPWLFTVVGREASEDSIGGESQELLAKPSFKVNGTHQGLLDNLPAALPRVCEGQSANHTVRRHEEAWGDGRPATPS